MNRQENDAIISIEEDTLSQTHVIIHFTGGCRAFMTEKDTYSLVSSFIL